MQVSVNRGSQSVGRSCEWPWRDILGKGLDPERAQGDPGRQMRGLLVGPPTCETGLII